MGYICAINRFIKKRTERDIRVIEIKNEQIDNRVRI